MHPERGPDINDRLVARNRRRHDVVGEQQDRPHGAQGRVQQTPGRVHAAPVRIDTADDRVGPADDEDEPADGGDEIRRRHPGVEKSQPEHVEAAGAQVAEEHRTGQEPLQVAGTIVTNEHEGFRAGNSPTEQTTRHDSATTPTLANRPGTGTRASPRPYARGRGLESVLHDCTKRPTSGTDPYRGAGRPESKYILERLIDQAARETGIDRVELRRRNLIPPDAFPWQAPNGQTYDSGEFEAILDEALEKSDWAGFEARRATATARFRLRGIGISCYLENTAPAGELADIRFEADGTVSLITGTRDLGTGHATPFAQILCGRLGVPFEAVRLIQDDSDAMSPGASGSGGSKSLLGTGNAIIDCSAAIIETGRAAAAHVLETATEDIVFTVGTGGGRFSVAGTDRAIGIMELAAALRGRDDLPDGVPRTLDTKATHATSPASFPNGCHVCEVEIDPETGATDILRYTVVDDFGVMINPPIVAGQVHGGIAQGIGQIMLERTVYDDDGQLITGSWLDYAMPRADDLVSIDFSTHNVPCVTNPLGIKGCGEA
ncbi:MAG: molybdopterin-dependent oxidoreductase, partial [Planctomycetes bacterium]|nr:molybdopterin-dependent oxidoreductase [Planctomycetota bacterium]